LELKILPELKIANFRITISRTFCDSLIQSIQILDFDRNNLITHFCYSELFILREKKVCGFFEAFEVPKELRVLSKY